jgi:hypothetical protein
MTDDKTYYVFSTSTDRVWIVRAEDDSPDEAMEFLNQRYADASWDRLYYEGVLDQYVPSSGQRDELINP